MQQQGQQPRLTSYSSSGWLSICTKWCWNTIGATSCQQSNLPSLFPDILLYRLQGRYLSRLPVLMDFLAWHWPDNSYKSIQRSWFGNRAIRSPAKRSSFPVFWHHNASRMMSLSLNYWMVINATAFTINSSTMGISRLLKWRFDGRWHQLPSEWCTYWDLQILLL